MNLNRLSSNLMRTKTAISFAANCKHLRQYPRQYHREHPREHVLELASPPEDIACLQRWKEETKETLFIRCIRDRCIDGGKDGPG